MNPVQCNQLVKRCNNIYKQTGRVDLVLDPSCYNISIAMSVKFLDNMDDFDNVHNKLHEYNIYLIYKNKRYYIMDRLTYIKAITFHVFTTLATVVTCTVLAIIIIAIINIFI